MLATWAWHDPEGLLTWFRSGYLPDEFRHARIHVRGPNNESIGQLITHWLALRNPLRAARFIIEDIYQFKTNIAPSGTAEALTTMLVSSRDHQQICQELLPYYERHQRHLGEMHQVLLSWQDIDAEAANAFLKRYPEAGPRKEDLAAQQVHQSTPDFKPNVAEQQLAAAPVEERAAVMETIVSAWAMQDVEAASRWLANQGKEAETIPAHAALAQKMAETNPQAGIAHAANLATGSLLESTTESIITDWAERSMDEALAFLESNPFDWPSEHRDRLYQLAITTPTK